MRESFRALARGSILVFQTILVVSPIRKAVVADRHNLITHVIQGGTINGADALPASMFSK